MSERVMTLADEFRRVASEVVALANDCDDAGWRTSCEGEGWTVGAVFRHIAWAMEAETEGLLAFVNDLPLPAIFESWDDLNCINHEQSEAFADARRAETIALLVSNAEQTEMVLRGLNNTHMTHERIFPLADEVWTGDNVTEYVLIGHSTGHLESIMTALRR